MASSQQVTPLTSELIEGVVARLREVANPRTIILFGSYSRGEETPGSDLDLVVILPEVHNHVYEMVRLRHALIDIDMPIDVLVYSESDVATRGAWPGTALHEALATGQVLYGNR